MGNVISIEIRWTETMPVHNLRFNDVFDPPLHSMIVARPELLDMLELRDILMKIVLDQGSSAREE